MFNAWRVREQHSLVGFVRGEYREERKAVASCIECTSCQPTDSPSLTCPFLELCSWTIFAKL
jgi:hypothetical protein